MALKRRCSLGSTEIENTLLHDCGNPNRDLKVKVKV